MKKMISAAEIGQFRHVVTNINRTSNFVGLDENGEAIYDPSLKKPIITFKGSVKLHGTFSAVCYNDLDGVWFQSKNNIIGIGNDNAGFAFFATSKESVFIEIIKSLAKFNNINLSENSIMLPMEWVGRGIQAKVAISNLEKSAFIFSQAKVKPFDEDKISYWISTKIEEINVKSPADKIFNINDYKTYEITIDFNNPQLSQNLIINMTLEVEDECPVSKEFGEIGIGEGIVFTYLMSDGTRHIFKSKGEKHSKSKVKTLRPVDNEKLALIYDVSNEVTPSWRLDQFFNEITNHGKNIDRKYIGDYIRAVINDVYKEDVDIITASGLESKDINSHISKIAKDYFFAQELI